MAVTPKRGGMRWRGGALLAPNAVLKHCSCAMRCHRCNNTGPMANEPTFASIGKPTDSIDVRLSYRIIELFSEGLYASPNKAIEELVANSFDAGAQRVQVLLSSNLHDQNATVAVIDDGEGMDGEGLKRHWLIGISNKRHLAQLPRGRQQIGRFGI